MPKQTDNKILEVDNERTRDLLEGRKPKEGKPMVFPPYNTEGGVTHKDDPAPAPARDNGQDAKYGKG